MLQKMKMFRAIIKAGLVFVISVWLVVALFGGTAVKEGDTQTAPDLHNLYVAYIASQYERVYELQKLEEQHAKQNEAGETEPQVDKRVEAIRDYLYDYGSPLAEYAELMVKTADKYGIDYRLIPAIAIIESSGGKRNFRPYNAWGLKTKRQFKSYEESIEYVGKLLGKSYENGCKTIECIKTWYCPPCGDKWVKDVRFVMNKIRKYEHAKAK